MIENRESIEELMRYVEHESCKMTRIESIKLDIGIIFCSIMAIVWTILYSIRDRFRNIKSKTRH